MRRPDAAVAELECDRCVVEHGRCIVAAGLERGEVHCGLHQRADRPTRIERPVEAFGADGAPADDGDDVAAVWVGNDHRSLEVCTTHAARCIETAQVPRKRLLCRRLRTRIEGRVHGESGGSQICLGVVALQVPADQIEIGRDVASRPCAVGVLARVIVGRPLDQPDQQREFADVELCEWFGEEVLATESESMYGTRAVLTEIHFVEVRNQDVVFGKVRLQPESHHGFGRLAADGLLVR